MVSGRKRRGGCTIVVRILGEQSTGLPYVHFIISTLKLAARKENLVFQNGNSFPFRHLASPLHYVERTNCDVGGTGRPCSPSLSRRMSSSRMLPLSWRTPALLQISRSSGFCMSTRAEGKNIKKDCPPSHMCTVEHLGH